jgi:hypothetical protein
VNGFDCLNYRAARYRFGVNYRFVSIDRGARRFIW